MDFETANNSRLSACSLGLAIVENGKVIGSQLFLIRPPSQQFLFTHIHGIRWEDVKFAANFKNTWPVAAKYFEGVDFIVCHNAPFDKSVLSECLKDAGLPEVKSEYRCTLKLAREKLKIPKHNLAAVCKHLDIPLKHHDALSDAEACAQVYLRLIGL